MDGPTRYSTSRQKACLGCSSAKAKCDRKPSGCTRCLERRLTCLYTVPKTPPGNSNARSRAATDGNSANNKRSAADLEPTSQPLVSVRRALRPLVTTPRDSGSLDFSNLDLTCPINADSISNRWLNPYIPGPGQTPKNYPRSVTAFINRVLRSYASIIIHGRGVPPFVHPMQMTPSSWGNPLFTCLNLARACEGTYPGSDDVIAGLLQREMDNVHRIRGTYNDMGMLVAFQSYLIYSMILYTRLGQGSHLFLRQAMMNLQELAGLASQRGIVCIAEQQRARPSWEAWIVAEAKRRTLYVMYLFDSLLSAQDGLPTYLGAELKGLLAPANKTLWNTRARRDWQSMYTIHLAEWIDGGLSIDELWPIPSDLDEDGVIKRQARIDQWLEDVDEFGTMLYAVTSCTHGT